MRNASMLLTMMIIFFRYLILMLYTVTVILQIFHWSTRQYLMAHSIMNISWNSLYQAYYLKIVVATITSKNLELTCFISLRTHSFLVDLTRIQDLTLKPPVDLLSLMIFIRAISNLRELSMDRCFNLDFIEQMRGNRFEHLNCENNSHILEGLLCVFSYVKHLRASFLSSVMNMISTIDGFKHFSCASFTIYEFNTDIPEWFFERKSSICDVRPFSKDTFACRFSCSSSSSLLSDIHVWILEQMNAS